MNKPQIIVHATEDVPYTVFDVQWYPCSAKLASIGSQPKGTGVVDLFEFNDGRMTKVGSASLPNALKCGTFGASPLTDRFIAVGDFKGRISTVDLEKMQTVCNVGAHEDIVNSMDGFGGLGANGKGPPEIVTSSRDGSVKVWDIRVLSDGPVAVLSPELSGSGPRDCWTACFGDVRSEADRCVAAGFDNGDLKIFDLRAAKVRWETNLKNGVVCTEFDRPDGEGNKLIATTLEGRVVVFDLRTLHPTDGYASADGRHGAAERGTTVWAARHSPSDRDVFMVCGGDGNASLWKYDYPEKRTQVDEEDGSVRGVAGNLRRLQVAKVSSQPVNAFRWNPDLRGLAVCSSFDQALRVLIVTKLATIS